jgi:NTE family protein
MAGDRKNISLVLGSGGARGYAHIGVIQWLEENGYRIESIVGSSMGALVGGIHALGKLEQYREWVCTIDKIDVFRLLDFSLGEGGLVKGERLMNALKQFMEDRRIEDLSIRYTAVASDIANEKEVWINRGNIFDAIRASISLPLFFTPYRRNGVYLLDGGILNPVPIAPTFQDDSDRIIAVNLAGTPSREYRRDEPSTKDSEGDGISAKIQDFIQALRQGGAIRDKLGFYDVIDQAFDAMQGTIARQKIAAYPPDILVELPRNLCGMLEFDRAGELINAGYRAAAEQIPTAEDQLQ